MGRKAQKKWQQFHKEIKILNKNQIEISRMKASWKHYEHTRSSRRKDTKEGTQDQSNTTFRHQWRKINNIPQLPRTLGYVQKDNLNILLCRKMIQR